MIVRDIFS